MGEKQNQPFHLGSMLLGRSDFQGPRVTSNAGLILVRELHERLGLEKLIEEHLIDSRQGLNKQFTLADLRRQSVDSRSPWFRNLGWTTSGLDVCPPFLFENLFSIFLLLANTGCEVLSEARVKA
jgi:hypothetical protein